MCEEVKDFRYMVIRMSSRGRTTTVRGRHTQKGVKSLTEGAKRKEIQSIPSFSDLCPSIGAKHIHTCMLFVSFGRRFIHVHCAAL